MNDEATNANNQDGGIFGTPLSFSSQSSGSTTTPNDETIIPKTSIIGTPIEAPAEEPAGQDDLISMGVTFVSDKAPQQEKNIFSKDSSFKDKELEQIASKPQQESEVKKPEPTPVKSVPVVETKDLEADFSKTFNTPLGVQKESDATDPIALEEEKLKRLHKELKDKAGAKKVVVKERLEKLRKEKESLGKELEEIKELELIASKIEEKLKNLETIDTEIDTLEEQAHKELIS